MTAQQYTRSAWVAKQYEKRSFKHPQKVNDRIHSIALNHHLINPTLKISDAGEYLYVSQKRCRGKRTEGVLSRKQIIRLAEIIDAWHDAGFIHGDLCISNIFVTDNGDLEVIDWEPALEVYDGDSTSLRSTQYCVHPEDLSNHCISYKTDYFALATYFLIATQGRQYLSRMAMYQHLRQRMAVRIQGFESAYELVSDLYRSIQ